MKIIMAVSHDGYVARDAHDDMGWAGSLDKQLFKAMTMSDSRKLAAGMNTARIMPSLKGREIVPIRRGGMHVCHPLRPLMQKTTDCQMPSEDVDGPVPIGSCSCMTLLDFDRAYPDSFLIGGQTVALKALSTNLVTEMHLFVQLGVVLGGGVKERLRESAYADGSLLRMREVTDVVGPAMQHVRVEHWF